MTTEQKRQIRSEEIFRDEIRKSLAKKKSLGNKFKDFLNTNLGIFILSATFLSGLSFVYTQLQERVKQKNAATEKKRLLELEIKHRLSFLGRLTKEPFPYTDFHTVREALYGRSKETPRGQDISDFDPIFSEFDKRTLFALYYELHSISDVSEQEFLDNALKDVQDIMSMLSSEDHLQMVAPRGQEDSKWKFKNSDLDTYADRLNSLVSKGNVVRTLQVFRTLER
ncbi:hypothetical protein MJD09_28195 [bacterium]|nr:hypothetical protein [bacterium]